MELEQHHLLQKAQSKFPLAPSVCDAFEKIPRHMFLDHFSADYQHWLSVSPETMDLIYADTTLLLYYEDGFTSTISQPSFVLKMLELLDLKPGMQVFELGAGSGWNAALMGFLVGRGGLVKSYEIIPEMTLQAQRHVEKFDLPQVKIIQGDALTELALEEDVFDRGMFTAGARDLPGMLFEKIKEGGKLLFVLKTNLGDLLLAMERKKDHFEVFEKIHCQFVSVTGASQEDYYNDLSELLYGSSPITIWPQGTLSMGENVVAGRDMVFKLG